MEMDTIDAIRTAISPYATAHDPSKLDLHISPQSQYNTNPYSEDDNHSTSGDSTESNEEGCQDDYETPISAPDSRRASQEEMRRSHESSQQAHSRPATAEHEDSFETSELTIRPRQHTITNAPMGNTASALPPPPAYIPDSQDISIFRHFKGPAPIQHTPEGTEQLPAYKANIELSNVFLRKSEYYNLTTRTFDRKWRRVIANLTGTKLEIFAATRPFYRHLPTHPDLPYHVKKGSLIKTYSLQHAEMGLATDYLKRKFVIRLRVEAEQFLLSCTEIETLVAWMEGLQWSAGMALELDEREEVKETTLPRNLRRRRRARTAVSPGDALAQAVADAIAAEREEDSGAAGEERLREARNLSHASSQENINVEEETAPDPEPEHGVAPGTNHLYTVSAFSSMASTPNISRSATPAPSTIDLQQTNDGMLPLATNYHNHNRTQSSMNILFRSIPRPSAVARPTTSSGGRDGMAGYPSTLSQSITNLAAPSNTSSSNGTPNHSSLNLSKKNKKRKNQKDEAERPVKVVWQPRARWSASYDLAYAKKCMPVLLRDARRKTIWVFYEGERCVIRMGNTKGKDGKRVVVMERVERITGNIVPLVKVEPPAFEAVGRKESVLH